MEPDDESVATTCTTTICESTRTPFTVICVKPMAFAPRAAVSTAVKTAVFTPSLECSLNCAVVSITAIPSAVAGVAFAAESRNAQLATAIQPATRIVHLLNHVECGTSTEPPPVLSIHVQERGHTGRKGVQYQSDVGPRRAIDA